MYTMSRARAVYDQRFKPPPPPARVKYLRHDWNRMRTQAFEQGTLPEPPVMLRKEHQKKVEAIYESAKAGDIKRVLNIRTGDYNSSAKTVGIFRDICVIALTAQQRLNQACGSD
jgi:hypothetical protein